MRKTPLVRHNLSCRGNSFCVDTEAHKRGRRALCAQGIRPSFISVAVIEQTKKPKPDRSHLDKRGFVLAHIYSLSDGEVTAAEA